MEQLQTEIGLLLKGKSPFSSKTTKELGGLVDKYPYAPIFHFLYLRGLQEEDSYKFPSQLNRSSVSTMNRSALLNWAETPLIPIEIQIAALEDSDQESWRKFHKFKLQIIITKRMKTAKNQRALKVKEKPLRQNHH